MAEGYNLSMLAVLIADKNAHMRRMLRSILRELNVRMVSEAATPEEAIKLLAVKPLDLAFVEWAPDFDGNAIVRQTRRDPKAMSRMIPIITTSAYTEVQHVIAARDSGSDQFLAKPFTAKMIFQHLKAVSSRSSAPRPISARAGGASKSPRPTVGSGAATSRRMRRPRRPRIRARLRRRPDRRPAPQPLDAASARNFWRNVSMGTKRPRTSTHQ